MPELPEVETIRKGLEPYLKGNTIKRIETYHPRVARHDPAGFADLTGQIITEVARRGKYLWFRIGEDRALVAHLRMSGQFRINSQPHPHRRASLFLADGIRLDFLDQRTFGYLHADKMIPTLDGMKGWYAGKDALIPSSAVHLAHDLLAQDGWENVLAPLAKQRKTRIKALLLDQRFVSGIGNIYADEALWEAQINALTPANQISITRLKTIFLAAKNVMIKAIAAGGTSFDALYVNVDGSSGYFARELNAYGRAGKPCKRCGTLLVREPFMGRSSSFCPKCQARKPSKKA